MVENLLGTFDEKNEFDPVIAKFTFDTSEKINSALQDLFLQYEINNYRKLIRELKNENEKAFVILILLALKYHVMENNEEIKNNLSLSQKNFFDLKIKKINEY